MQQLTFFSSNLLTSARTLLLCVFTLLSGMASAAPVKVAFVGDQGVGEHAQAVLALIASEGTDLLLIQGDLGYKDNAAALWDTNLDIALGADFPVLTVVGNHENHEWPLYQKLIQQRVDRVNSLSCSGEVGVKAACRFANIDIVQVAPGIREVEGVSPDDNYAQFIDSSFSDSGSRWRICSWHKNQEALQTGAKSNSTGWEVYDACLNAGAMVALAHEHAYSRTYLLSDFENQTIVHKNSDMTLQPGQSFAFVSGLGGWQVRPQLRGGDWWASIYTATQGATHGALFCSFEDTTAECYFKAINGAVPDQFSLTLITSTATESQPAIAISTDANTGPDIAVNSTDAGEPLPINVPSSVPSQPSALRHAVYSNTAAEIFWDRSTDDKLVVGYEIQTNGEKTVTIDALSYFTNELLPGKSYEFTVTAIDKDGNRSPSASLQFKMSGGAEPSSAPAIEIIQAQNQPPPPAVVNPISPPSALPSTPSLRYEVYSRTAAELFWDRSTGSSTVVGYEILINGQLTANLDALSYFSDSLVAGKPYEFVVTAIDRDGNRSSPAAVTFISGDFTSASATGG